MIKKHTYISNIYFHGISIIDSSLLWDWLIYCKSCLKKEKGSFELTLTMKIIKIINKFQDIEDFIIKVIDKKIDEMDGFTEGVYFSNNKDEFIKIYKLYKNGNEI